MAEERDSAEDQLGRGPDGPDKSGQPKTPDADAGSEGRRSFEELSRSPRIQSVPFDERAVALIASELDVSASTAPFRLPSSTVWQITLPGAQERPAALLTLWPGIRRVDVVAGSVTVVFTDIAVIDLVPDVEVQFRRASREVLIVARGGKVIVRA